MFKPGESGNPNGRPKQKPFLDWCKKWAVARGEAFLTAIAENPRHKNQLDAIKTIFAYGYGKPVEFTESTHDFSGMGQSADEARSALEKLIAGKAEGSPGSLDGTAIIPVAQPAGELPAQRSAGEATA